MTTNPPITASEMGRRGRGLAKVRGNRAYYAKLASARWRKARRIARERKNLQPLPLHEPPRPNRPV